ncbi:DUF4124 domain-containing protein [Parendozoicomonas sp. Alg238-R29]|uniref:DUF4124 domain-containing protein n=1 Tax=Parendozoicomonas sp. Alg238-R29 TaxID=2993446 RepID=UPI00248D9BEC|nr:DUF4124 domain-containing protein [Parendozoicomonas sp. Alg238-R29]
MNNLTKFVFLLSFIPGLAYSGVYKCETASGKITYQSTSCANDDKASTVKVSASRNNTAKDKDQNKSASNNDPSGIWSSQKNRKLKANISKHGSFSMTDTSGESLKGKWKKSSDGVYIVEARFQGVSFPVNMKYETSTDTLLLSKPGLPNTFNRYQRQ